MRGNRAEPCRQSPLEMSGRAPVKVWAQSSPVYCVGLEVMSQDSLSLCFVLQ
jgi:hypothetical protein